MYFSLSSVRVGCFLSPKLEMHTNETIPLPFSELFSYVIILIGFPIIFICLRLFLNLCIILFFSLGVCVCCCHSSTKTKHFFRGCCEMPFCFDSLLLSHTHSFLSCIRIAFVCTLLLLPSVFFWLEYDVPQCFSLTESANAENVHCKKQHLVYTDLPKHNHFWCAISSARVLCYVHYISQSTDNKKTWQQ